MGLNFLSDFTKRAKASYTLPSDVAPLTMHDVEMESSFWKPIQITVVSVFASLQVVSKHVLAFSAYMRMNQKQAKKKMNGNGTEAHQK